MNQTRYDMGCAYPEFCTKGNVGNVFGKRTDHSHIVCQQCCNDTPICNADLPCNGHPQVLSDVCLSCSGVESPSICQHTTICSKDEVCFMHKYRTQSNIEMFDLGCKHSMLCTNSHSNIFGRRDLDGRHFICESCCQGSAACNKNLLCDHFKQKTHNDTCTSENECESNLLCSSGVCQCQSENYYWDQSHCVTKKGEQNSCNEDNECYEGLYCIDGRCQRLSLYYWNGTNCAIRKGYLESCHLSIECGNTLYCINEQCKCDTVDFWSGISCTRKKMPGTSCRSTKECIESLRCIDGKCLCSINVEYWSGTECAQNPHAKECSEIPSVKDGVYTIWPNGVNNVSVYCVGQWTVIQKRYDGSVDFKRNWNDFKTGFGSANGEYWIGNDNIHLISTNGPHQIRILMTLKDGTEIYANYSTFNVGDESSKYLMTISGYSGNAGDKMGNGSSQPMNGQQFTTIDQDNDKSSGVNCAVIYAYGAWWHNDCFQANLNAIYGSLHFRWSEAQEYLRKSVMMINRK